MVQVNMFDAKTNLSKLIAGLENNTNDVVLLARNGVPVAKITAIKQNTNKCGFVGAANGKYPNMSIESLEKLDEDYLSEFEEDML